MACRDDVFRKDAEQGPDVEGRVPMVGWSLEGFAAIAAVSVMAVVWCASTPVEGRLHGDAAQRGRTRGGHDDVRRRVGLSATIAAVTARVRNGGEVVAAFEEQAGHGFAVRELDARRLRTLLRERAADDEADEVDEIASMTAAACSLSRTLGCSMVRCLDAVADRHRHIERMRRLREAAFATPRSTVRLLSALPLLTLVVGMALGANPLDFLFDGGAGTLCLIAGIWCHVLGTVWLCALFDRCRERMEGP